MAIHIFRWVSHCPSHGMLRFAIHSNGLGALHNVKYAISAKSVECHFDE